MKKDTQKLSPVYICHSRNDETIAAEIRKLLSGKSIPVHDGLDQLSFGMDMATALSDIIKACSNVIVILSECSLLSPWLWKEVEVAIGYGKRIIPIQVKQIGLSKIPNSIRQINILDLEKVLSSPRLLESCLAPFDNQPHIVAEESKINKLNKVAPVKYITYRHNPSKKKTELEIIWDKYAEEQSKGVRHMSRQPSRNRLQMSVRKKRPRRRKRNTNRHVWWLVGLGFLVAAILFFVLSRWQFFLPSLSDNVSVLQERVLFLQASIIIVIIVAIGVCLCIISRYKTKLNNVTTNVNLTSDSKVLMNLNEERMVLKKKDPYSLDLPLGGNTINLDYLSFNSPRRINCFIAGSLELQLERDVLRSAISMVYNLWKDKNFQILSFTFEDFDRKFTKDGHQPLYDHFITTEADYAVFLIKGPVGDKTRAEFEKAYQAFQVNNRPSIIAFSDKNGKDDESTRAFRKRFDEINQYWIDYSDLKELNFRFRELFSADLWGIYKNDL